jgi:hypothetical protein
VSADRHATSGVAGEESAMERFKDWLTVLTLAALCALAGEAQAQVATTQPSPASLPPAAASSTESVPNVLVNDLKVRN